MGRRPHTTPDQITGARIKWLRVQMGEIRRDIRASREESKVSQLPALHRELRALRDQIDLGLLQQAQHRGAVSVTERPEDLSPEEWASRVRAAAEAHATEDLEVYVGEWLRRNKLLLLVEGDAPRLVRAG